MAFAAYKSIEWIQHFNPDGAPGGLVAKGARVGRNVTIGRTSRVMPDAVVDENSVIDLGILVTRDGEMRFS